MTPSSIFHAFTLIELNVNNMNMCGQYFFSEKKRHDAIFIELSLLTDVSHFNRAYMKTLNHLTMFVGIFLYTMYFR